MGVTILTRIRQETRDLHERLESELDFPGSELTLKRYRSVLGRFYGFYVTWEEELRPWTSKLGAQGAALHPKLPDLIRDLDFLEISRDSMRVCPAVPACESIPQAIGSLYVREGSALGGQYISRQLESRLGFANGAGYQFFSSGGRSVGPEWRAFQKLMLEHSSAENDQAMIESARRVFESIRVWLCERT